MSAATGEPQAYPHPHVNEAWLAKLHEDIIDPALPIVDAHHHLWERLGRYLLDELRADLASGITCGPPCSSSAARLSQRWASRAASGGRDRILSPPPLRSAEAAGLRACAGIVGHCDFRWVSSRFGAGGAHRGRRWPLQGIRQSAGLGLGDNPDYGHAGGAHLLMDPAFRVGLGGWQLRAVL